jgi:hypothetical protein
LNVVAAGPIEPLRTRAAHEDHVAQRQVGHYQGSAMSVRQQTPKHYETGPSPPAEESSRYAQPWLDKNRCTNSAVAPCVWLARPRRRHIVLRRSANSQTSPQALPLPARFGLALPPPALPPQVRFRSVQPKLSRARAHNDNVDRASCSSRGQDEGVCTAG